jgi:exonuclease SbcD
MRILHTSDWHVGKTLRGRNRADEHRAVLAELADEAAKLGVDLILVCGDLFETAAPTAESEGIVYDALVGLAKVAPVVVVAGNHDNARRLAAVAPILTYAGVTVATSFHRADDGGVLELDAGGVKVRLALLPFLSQRYVVRADDLMAKEPTEHAQTYADRVHNLIVSLASAFDTTAVNLVASHLMVAGGQLGGGERGHHTMIDYAVSSAAFPRQAHYIALGHLHRQQEVNGPCPAWYSGSPLQLDFSEHHTKGALLVDATPGVPAQVTPVPLRAGRELRTLEGPLDDLRPLSAKTGDAFLKIVLDEPPRLGLADEVRELFPEAVDICVRQAAPAAHGPTRSHAEGRSPHDLFDAYLGERAAQDREELINLFDELLDAEVSTGSGA